jgi:hypothetical protein
MLGETISRVVYAKQVEASTDGFVKMLKEAKIEKISKNDFSRMVLAAFEALAAGMSPQEAQQFRGVMDRLRMSLESQMDRFPGAQLSLFDAGQSYKQLVAPLLAAGIRLPEWNPKDPNSPVTQSVTQILDDIQAGQDVNKGTGKIVTPQQTAQDEMAKKQLQKPGMGQLKPIPKRPPPPPPAQ